MQVFTQIIILIVILAAMTMILLAIRQLTHNEGFDDNEETIKLKDEIRDDDRILSHNNIFRNLVDSEDKFMKKERIPYKSESKEPEKE